MKGTIHEGQRLKEYLEQNGISSNYIREKLKLSNQSLYYQFRREFLSPNFKSKLAAIEIDFFQNTHATGAQYPADYERLKRDAEKLREIIILQAQHIEELRKSLAEVETV